MPVSAIWLRRLGVVMSVNHVVDGDLSAEIRALTGAGRRMAFVSGNFNIVHPGHLRLLTFARESADFLVVAVNFNGSTAITLPADLRLEAVNALAMVDYAFLLHEPVSDFLAKLQPDIVVKGKEYEERRNPEQEIVESYGGRVLFSSGEVRFSSLNLIQREYLESDFSSIRAPSDFPARHGFALNDLKDALRAFNGLRVLVVGDLIIDNYVTCDPVGMSQEDPTIVVTPLEEKTFVGGAGIVAAHASGLGANVRFISVAGNDDKAEFARKALTSYGVDVDLLIDETRPTTFKRRYRAHGKTLLRVNTMRQHAIEHELEVAMIERAEAEIASADVVLFSDFNYGCLTQTVVDALVKKGRRHDVMMAADSQASSQLSDISRFKNMDLITPTEREARLAVRDFESGLVVLAENLQKAARVKNVVITLGGEGLLCYAPNGDDYMTDRLPAFNSAPKDPAGAGDSLFTSAALALRAGVDIWQAAYLGALAAACQVSRVGNTPLTRDDLISEINQAQF